MPTRKSLRPRPAEYLASGEWPKGRLRKDAPPEARLALAISMRLGLALADRAIREVAREAELSPQTVANLLQGSTWGDVVTIARLECALGADLWGEEHRG